jgi:CDP-diacylglycerol--glycerol-3-phosphate 3-phosphatidyltransferase
MKRLPNILTISRVFLTIGFVFCLLHGSVFAVGLAMVLFSLASLTDFYDGYYAKKHNLVSNFGKIMDPIADKFLSLTAFFIFVIFKIIPAWMFYVIFSREVFVTGSRILAMTKGKFLAAERAGKYKTVVQISTIIIILLFILCDKAGLVSRWEGLWLYTINFLMLVTVALTLFSGIFYLWHNRRILLSNNPT